MASEIMTIRRTISAAALLSIGLIGSALFSAPVSAQTDGLVKAESSFDMAYVLPDVDWSKFKKINIYPLAVTPEARDTSRRKTSRPSGRGESWIIRGQDVQMMKDEFARITQREIEKKEAFEVVAISDAETLIVIPQIIDIYLTAPPQRANSRNEFYSETSGSLTISVVLADGETGEVIARAQDEKTSSRLWRENTRIRNIQDMRRIYSSWGRQFRERLQELASGEQPQLKK